MALKQTIIWTALPGGVLPTAPARLRLSVFASPRLQDDGAAPAAERLAQFPELADWPATVSRLSFTFAFQGGGSFTAAPVGPAPESALWQALFPADTPVSPHRFSGYGDRFVRSFPVRNTTAFLQGLYQAQGRAGDDAPALAAVVRALAPLALRVQPDAAQEEAERRRLIDLPRAARVQIIERRAQALAAELLKGAGGPTPPGLSEALTQDLLWLIQDARSVLTPAARAALQQIVKRLAADHAVAPGAPEPTTDFLQAALYYRPRSARDLGHDLDPRANKDPYRHRGLAAADLSVDFHRRVAAVGAYPRLLRALGLVLDFEVPVGPGTPPSTAGPGMVSVSVAPSRPFLVPTTQTSPRTAYQLAGAQFIAAPRGTELDGGMLRLSDPAYLTVQVDEGGAAIKALDFAANMGRQLAHRKFGTPERAPLPALRSAGLGVARTGRALQLAKGQRDQAARNADLEAAKPVTLYAEDVTRGYRFDVWDERSGRYRSLFERVGSYRFGAGLERGYEDEGFWQSSATQPADGSTKDLYVSETLLRWTGWSLAAPRPGKVIGPDDADRGGQPDIRDPAGPGSGVNQALTSLRTQFWPRPGSLPRLRFGVSYRVRARAVDLAGGGLSREEADALPGGGDATAATAYLRFEPVPAPPLSWEKEPPGARVPGESLAHLVIRSNFDRSVHDYTPGFNAAVGEPDPGAREFAERRVDAPLGSAQLAELHGKLDKADGTLDKGAFYDKLVKKGGGDPAADPDGSLPDPASQGAALRWIDPVGGVPALKQVSFYPAGAAWPEARPFSLRLVEGSAPAAWDEAQRLLTVALPKAEQVELRLSSLLGGADLTHVMGQWRWIEEGGPADLAELRRRALEGRNELLTPSSLVTLVHAVQQPLRAPSFEALIVTRQLGVTRASLIGQISLDGKSTGQVDVEAAWEDPVDDVAQAAPAVIPGQAQVFTAKIDGDDRCLAFDAYAPRAHELGDTRHRRVRYRPVGTTRFREYFPAGTAPLTREGDAVDVNVLSAARPAAPRVLYVVPTFGWARGETALGPASLRAGGGLRVYLDRPWYSSGAGELLGVLLRHPLPRTAVTVAAPAYPEALRPYVTQWGMDPIWASSPTLPDPLPQHFPRAVRTEDGLSLAELPGSPLRLGVVGHEVAYDPERRLWYCDLEIEAGPSYFPFVRLALARYQPDSLRTQPGEEPDCCLSPVVLADFAQLAPHRAAVVMNDLATPPDARAVTIAVAGVSYSHNDATRESLVEVTVEARRDGARSDLDEWAPTGLQPVPLRRMGTPAVGYWGGRVLLPTPRGSAPYRLVIKEYEVLYTDRDNLRDPPFRQRRLVFAETFVI